MALLFTLALLAIASSLLVAFVVMVRTDRSATFSYSQSIKADQLARGGLQLVVAGLRGEMAKDAAPDTGGGAFAAVYTNVAPANLRPQPVGTNAAMPLLVKASCTNAPFSGGAATGTLAASGSSSTASAVGGRTISLARWSQACLGTFPSASAAPCWVVVTRSGPTNAAGLSFGATGNTLNNASAGNPNWAVGRFAYAVYDVGGLLDVTVAGHPSGLSAAVVQALKGTLAGADLSGLGIDADKLTAWRNAATVGAYPDYVTNYLSTNGARAVYPGDTTFLSRQDLIQAAKKGVAGLSTSVLTNLTVFTREKDAPSWGPSYNAADLGGNNGAGSVYAYKDNALATASTNRFVPAVRFANGATVTGYHSDGTSYTYAVKAGDPLLQRRFPLDRLTWLGPSGPQNGGTAAGIQACFGLLWDTSSDPNLAPARVWKYVGATGATEASGIKTLAQAAAEGREPNFFELLQAGILTGSLGVQSAKAYPSAPPLSLPAYQAFPAYQIFRIGACLVDQYDADSCPTLIEYVQSGAAVQAVGAENLPGVTLVTPVEGVPPTVTQDPVAGSANVTNQAYLMFDLWNPNRAAATPQARPPLRLHVQGYFTIGSNLGDFSTSTLAGPGYDLSLNTTIALSSAANAGANGFSTNAVVTGADVAGGSYQAPAGAAPTVAQGGAWSGTYPLGADPVAGMGPSSRTDMVGYRLPDFPMKYLAGTTTESTRWIFGVNGGTQVFNAYMEFQDPSGNWVPYQYWTGNGDHATWVNNAYVYPTPVGIAAIAGGAIYASPLKNLAGQIIAQPTGPQTAWKFSVYATWNACPLLLSGGDPRSTRFGLWEFSNRGYQTTAVSLLQEGGNLWTPTLAAASKTKAGVGGDQNTTSYDTSGGTLNNLLQYSPQIVGNVFFPAQLARNNDGSATAGSSTDNTVTGPGANTAAPYYNTSYQDKDGLRRVGDNGLFTDMTATVGNPFYRAADQPVILNRAFNSVGEMGYAFRDDPWRSLDFFSSKSADAGLLDLFCVHDDAVAPGGRLSALRHGTIDLNGRSPAAVAALLSGTLTDTVGGAATIGVPTALATNVVSVAAASPLLNKADLALRFSGSALPASAFGDADEQSIKARREAAVRALADAGQTRTWNLMIDLVAQAGRYSPASSSLDQFVVEGERRYWLHVAIDRFTGEIVDQQLEPVTE